MTLTDLSAAEMRHIYDEMERAYPDLWRICYPRIYSEPTCGQYYSPKEPARQIMGVAIKVEENMVGESEQYEFIAASHLVKYRVPMFWLSHDIALAIRQTVPPGQIPWYSMPMPFPAAVFMLPKGSLVHPSEGDVAFVGYARFPTGGGGISQLVKGIPYGSENGGMIFLALTMGGHLFHWNLPLDAYGETVSIPDVEGYATHLRPEERHGTGLAFLNQPHMSEEDNRLMVEVVHYVFGTILLMNHRPDLVTTGAMRKRVEGKRGERKEFWSPNIVGEHYRVRREQVDQGGTHASPRFHWVKGSYKQQAYGQGRELRKQIWVEPYTRGLDKGRSNEESTC